MDEAAARQHVREGARVVYIDERGWPTKLVWAESEVMVAIIIGVGGGFLALRLDEHGRVSEQTLFNPFAARMPRAKVIEHLSTWTIAPVPASLVDDLPRLATALRQTRTEIIDAYVARIRSGMTISGGPTTDQSWTVSSDGTDFAIRSYAPVGDGYEQRTEPLPETALRTMLATYQMFGLTDLPA